MFELQKTGFAEPVVEVLEEQLMAALQMLAALVLTPEEGERIGEARPNDGQPDACWIKSMREELLSEDWRPTLIDVLTRYSFYTNTHPGFPLSAFEMPAFSPWDMNEAFKTLEALLLPYSRGEGDDAPEKEKDENEYWKGRLVAEGVEADLAEWILTRGGNTMIPMAACNRIMSRHKP